MITEIQTDDALNTTTSNTFNIGDKLREERVKQGFAELDIAIELKIPTDQVRALESNNFNYFRSMTFARGFLKSYCRLLRMDHEEMLAAFDAERAGEETTIKPVDKVKKQSHLGDPIVIVISVIIVAMLIFLVFWWPSSTDDAAVVNTNNSESVARYESTGTDTDNKSVLESTAVPIPEESVTETERDKVKTNALNDSIDNGSVVTGLSAETKAILQEAGVNPNDVIKATADVPVEVAAVVEPQLQVQSPVYSDDIQVTFTADCWTEVRDSTGRILYSGVKSAGQELTITGKAPYRVVLGYADGVTSVKYKGENFDFSSFVRKGLARFELK